MRLLLVVAMDSEADALRSAAGSGPAGAVQGAMVSEGRIGGLEVVIARADIGPVCAAVATSAVLAADHTFDAAISTGIAGAFPGCGLDVGDLVVSTAIIDADLGMETAAGFETGASRGWRGGAVDCDPGLAARFAESLPARACQILTVTRLSAADGRIAELRTSFPDAPVEAMEGIGVAVAARAFDVPALEIRAISNLVGPQERYPWDPDRALAKLVAGLKRLR